MSAWSQVHFLRPMWLLALPLLPLLGWWWAHRRRRETAWRGHVDPHLLPHLLESGGRRRATGSVAMLALLLAILALAGPAWRLGENPAWRNRTPLVVALDLSSATLAPDLPPSRLLQARAKLATLLRERDGGEVGLVVFADDAYTVAPLTTDTGNIALFLDSLAPDVMPIDGQRADRAIAWSARLLRQAGFDRGDILLITDHADDAASREAQAAARAGYRVSVLGLGTAAGAPYRNADGLMVQARLDGDALSSLARAGNGSYATMSPGDADLRALDVLSAAEADSLAATGGGRRWRDEGYWLLPPLMLLALLAFRRGSLVAIVLLASLLPMPQALAQEQVLPARGTPWRRADQVAHARMREGERAYRAGDYARAAEQYAGIDDPDAHYNRGNALAKQGAYREAIAEYDRALGMQPRMADAIANKRAVQAAMKRKPKGQQDGTQKRQPNQGQQQGKQGQEQQGGQQDGGQQSPSQQSHPSGQSPSQSRQRQQHDSQRQDAGSQQQGQPRPSVPDAAAQRAADSAQRERMQRALQARRAQQGKDDKPAQAKPETPAERERRLANEAWLRRVPDDPGGLLRAKFRLEYERRLQGGIE